jgi:hypothetical protein
LLVAGGGRAAVGGGVTLGHEGPPRLAVAPNVLSSPLSGISTTVR